MLEPLGAAGAFFFRVLVEPALHGFENGHAPSA